MRIQVKNKELRRNKKEGSLEFFFSKKGSLSLTMVKSINLIKSVKTEGLSRSAVFQKLVSARIKKGKTK